MASSGALAVVFGLRKRKSDNPVAKSFLSLRLRQ